MAGSGDLGPCGARYQLVKCLWCTAGGPPLWPRWAGPCLLEPFEAADLLEPPGHVVGPLGTLWDPGAPYGTLWDTWG